jgi:hypothetical protein
MTIYPKRSEKGGFFLLICLKLNSSTACIPEPAEGRLVLESARINT